MRSEKRVTKIALANNRRAIARVAGKFCRTNDPPVRSNRVGSLMPARQAAKRILSLAQQVQQAVDLASRATIAGSPTAAGLWEQSVADAYRLTHRLTGCLLGRSDDDTWLDTFRQELARKRDDSVENRAVAMPSIKTVIEELRAAVVEFGDVEVDWEAGRISVQTDPIELEGVDLGPFAIYVKWPKWLTGNSDLKLSVKAIEPVFGMDGDTEYVHPHISSSDYTDLCLGDGKSAVAKALREGRICDAMMLVAAVLGTYSEDSCYVSIEAWSEGGLNQKTCSDCGRGVRPDEVGCCSYCGGDLCDRCGITCEHCENTVCGDCTKRCSCRDSGCKKCLCETCDRCVRSTCPGCRDECTICFVNVCDRCRTTCEGCDEVVCSGCSFPCADCGASTCFRCADQIDKIRCEACAVEKREAKRSEESAAVDDEVVGALTPELEEETELV